MGLSIVNLRKEQLIALLNNGVTYSVRSLTSKTNTIARARYDKKDVAIVEVIRVGRIGRSRPRKLYVVTNEGYVQLERFARESGFESAEEWIKYVENLYERSTSGVCLVKLSLLRRLPTRRDSIF